MAVGVSLRSLTWQSTDGRKRLKTKGKRFKERVRGFEGPRIRGEKIKNLGQELSGNKKGTIPFRTAPFIYMVPKAGLKK
jgi:hypothetical protein